ncbi:hypothetical protein CK203_078973 [Vitis vinifera]|uniref:Uncharacterized protein n=1 Tax=Vitis vinifera TaxID=29760 RepID=A0A438DA22_VITVI|nr:hypothetical protein CK203_078973 [Vitis vinifera]
MHGLRRVIVPATTMAIQNPSDPIPTQNPSDPIQHKIPATQFQHKIPATQFQHKIPTQLQYGSAVTTAVDALLACKTFKYAVVVQARDPSSIYYVADDSYRIFRPGIFSHPKEVSFEWIRAANQTTNLVVGRMYCSKCAQPAGWKSLRGANGTLLSVQASFAAVPPARPRY